MRINLPNALTLLRIFLVPFLVVVLLTKFDGREIVALGIFLIATATDFFDGWLARRRGEITTLGTLLDPIADKLLISAAFISLVEVGLAPAWMVVVVVGREFAVTGSADDRRGSGGGHRGLRLGKGKDGLPDHRDLAVDPVGAISRVSPPRQGGRSGWSSRSRSPPAPNTSRNSSGAS